MKYFFITSLVLIIMTALVKADHAVLQKRDSKCPPGYTYSPACVINCDSPATATDCSPACSSTQTCCAFCN